MSELFQINSQTQKYTPRWEITPQGFFKLVDLREFEFIKIASQNRIGPEIINIIFMPPDIEGPKILVELRKFTHSLFHTPNRDRFKNQVFDLYNKLHGINILHVDVHEDNIVVDEITGEVALIDFEASVFLNELDHPQVRETINFFFREQLALNPRENYVLLENNMISGMF